jgi:hypothetical protein
MPGTGIRSNPKTDHGLVFGGSLYSNDQKTRGRQFDSHRRFLLVIKCFQLSGVRVTNVDCAGRNLITGLQ